MTNLTNTENIDNIWIIVNEVSQLKCISKRAVRLSLNNNKYKYRLVNGRGGQSYKIKLSSLEEEFQTKYFQKISNKYIEINKSQQKIFSEKQRSLSTYVRDR